MENVKPIGVFPVLHADIEESGLSVLLINNCKQIGAETLEEALHIMDTDKEKFLHTFGEFSRKEIKEKLAEQGVDVDLKELNLSEKQKIVLRYPIIAN